MKNVYANPELRQRVSQNTARTFRDGPRISRNQQLAALDLAWDQASEAVRIEFLARRFVRPRAPSSSGGRKKD